MPCACVAVIRRGESPRFYSAGEANGLPVSPHSFFDLASLTKVVCTTTVAMVLADRHLLDLDAPVSAWLPGFEEGVRRLVTPQLLLAHCAGFPAGKPYHRLYPDVNQAQALALVRETPLEYTPRAATVYSDLGMIVLGQILEKIGQASLAQLAEELVFAPLQMHHTRFCPDATQGHFVPTEEIAESSGTYWTGAVHDETARWLGGCAGHAGLFSTAEDLARFGDFLLAGGAPLVSPGTFAQFTRPAGLVPGSTRCLGWDAPSPELSAEVGASPGAFWHTGFTGTALWCDPTAGTVIVLLTNAVHPRRSRKQQGYFPWRNRLLQAGNS
ncbi:MAG: beta-lactamase family protein [Victivallales bacterium]|nr:beta-lactamase family protein [Victivallales bacterium]